MTFKGYKTMRSCFYQTKNISAKMKYSRIFLDHEELNYNFETTVFATFYRTLKNMLKAEYKSKYGPLEDKMSMKDLMRKLKNDVTFELVTKMGRILTAETAGVFLAETTMNIYKLLCSIRSEFNTDRELENLLKIVKYGPDGSVKNRIYRVLYTLNEMSETYFVFEGVGITHDIDKISDFLYPRL